MILSTKLFFNSLHPVIAENLALWKPAISPLVVYKRESAEARLDRLSRNLSQFSIFGDFRHFLFNRGGGKHHWNLWAILLGTKKLNEQLKRYVLNGV